MPDPLHRILIAFGNLQMLNQRLFTTEELETADRTREACLPRIAANVRALNAALLKPLSGSFLCIWYRITEGQFHSFIAVFNQYRRVATPPAHDAYLIIIPRRRAALLPLRVPRIWMLSSLNRLLILMR